MKINKNIIIENLKTIFYALIIAVIIRSLLVQPFYIPSSSMEPNLLIGDRLFVTKYSYGYSKHSFPFSLPILKNRIFLKTPKIGDVVVFKTPADNRTDYIKRLVGLPGDVVVFKTPADNRTDYIKRLVGLPGDEIQFISGDLYINSNQVLKSRISKSDIIYCGKKINVDTFEEKLPNGKMHTTVYLKDYSFQNSDKFIVPKLHYFFLGDNRDCSKDSRYLTSVGYVHQDNLVGKAQFIFFSSDFRIGSIFSFWKWHKTIRLDRFFKIIN